MESSRNKYVSISGDAIKGLILQGQDFFFKDYNSLFVQRIPRYAIKRPGETWKTKKNPLSDFFVKAHLNKNLSVAVLGKWYPEYAILDIDNRPEDEAINIRQQLNLNEMNSMLISSESPDSYHILLKPQYNSKPPTIRLLQAILTDFANKYGIEIYPQANKAIRLPFGSKQECLDFAYAHLEKWEEKLFWFQKLNEFELSKLNERNDHLLYTPSIFPENLQPFSYYTEGRELLACGLQCPASRHESQFKVLYSFWKQNVPLNQAISLTYDWIKNKHNGFSKTMPRHPRIVYNEIKRQADWLYTNYDQNLVYPDSTHNNFEGYISKPDMIEIVKICNASRPPMKFLFHLVKYSYPRRFKSFIPVHRDKLIDWGSKRAYLKYLDRFEEMGILKRGSSYSVGRFSKNLRLNWKYTGFTDAILYEGRSVADFDSTIRVTFSPQEFKEILLSFGSNKDSSNKMINRIWKKEER